MKKLIFFLFALIFIALAMYVLLWSDKFKIHVIEITPTWMDRQEIIRLADVREEKNIFFYRTDLAEKALRDDPRIESANVSRKFPDTVRIDLVVREPFVTIVDGANHITLDRTGLVIEVNQPQRTPITLSGYRVSKVALGETVISQDAAALKKALDLANLVAQTDLKNVVLTNEPSQLVLSITDGFLVRFGTATDLEKQFSAFMALYEYLVSNGTTKGVIDAANPEAAVFKPFDN